MKNEVNIDQSAAIKEIISFRLPYFLRWGNLWLFLVLAGFIAMLVFIKFPNKVDVPAQIALAKPTIEIKSTAASVVTDFRIKNDELVQVGDVLLIYDSRARLEGIVQFEKRLGDLIQSCLSTGKFDSKGFSEVKFDDLGELKVDFQLSILSIDQASTFSQKIIQLHKLHTRFREWKNDHCVLAKISGFVVFNERIQENVQLKSGDIICFITPVNEDLILVLKDYHKFSDQIRAGQTMSFNIDGKSYNEKITQLSHSKNGEVKLTVPNTISSYGRVPIKTSHVSAKINMGEINLFENLFE